MLGADTISAGFLRCRCHDIFGRDDSGTVPPTLGQALARVVRPQPVLPDFAVIAVLGVISSQGDEEMDVRRNFGLIVGFRLVMDRPVDDHAAGDQIILGKAFDQIPPEGEVLMARQTANAMRDGRLVGPIPGRILVRLCPERDPRQLGSGGAGRSTSARRRKVGARRPVRRRTPFINAILAVDVGIARLRRAVRAQEFGRVAA